METIPESEVVWGVTRRSYDAAQWDAVLAIKTAYNVTPLRLCQLIFGQRWAPRRGKDIRWPTSNASTGFSAPFGVYETCSAWLATLRCVACGAEVTPEAAIAFTLRAIPQGSAWYHHCCSEICFGSAAEKLRTGTKRFEDSVLLRHFSLLFVRGFVAGLQHRGTTLHTAHMVVTFDVKGPPVLSEPHAAATTVVEHVKSNGTPPLPVDPAPESRMAVVSGTAVNRLTLMVQTYMARLPKNGDDSAAMPNVHDVIQAFETLVRELCNEDNVLLAPILETAKSNTKKIGQTEGMTNAYVLRTLLTSLNARLAVAATVNVPRAR